MTSRTQIILDPETHRRARKRASALGISFAEYVRRAIAKELGDSLRSVDVSAIFDLGSSRQPTNVGKDKQRMLDKAVSADRLRKTRRGPVDPSVIFDLGTAGEPTDIAKNKDRMIGEAVMANHKRKTRRGPVR